MSTSSSDRQSISAAAPYRPLGATRVGPRVVYEAVETNCPGGHGAQCAGLFVSQDAGRTWEPRSSPIRRADIESLAFATTRTGWLASLPGVRPGKLWVTRDGGRHWRRIAIPDVRAVAGMDHGVAVVAGRSVLVGSPDGRLRRVGPSAGDGLLVEHRAVYSYDNLPKVRSAPLRFVRITARMVHHGILPCSPRFDFAVALTQSPAGDLLAVCGSEPGMGSQLKATYRSGDGGTTWTRVAAPSVSGYLGSGATGSAGAFLDGGRAPLEVSDDDGASWHVAITGSSSAGGVRPIGFSGRRYGWACDFGPPAALYLSNDGGRTWSRAAPPSNPA